MLFAASFATQNHCHRAVEPVYSDIVADHSYKFVRPIYRPLALNELTDLSVSFMNIVVQVEMSPFVERLTKKDYEILYLVEAVDEYCLSSLPEFEGKKFQNVAKEGFTLEEDKKKLEDLQTRFQDLTKWLGDVALKDKVFLSLRILHFAISLVCNSYSSHTFFVETVPMKLCRYNS